jgi:hypothetical protein
MRLRRWILFLAVIPSAACPGCSLHTNTGGNPSSLTPAQKAAVDQDVRRFVSAVAHDVTQEGPAAWRKHFADDPSFFLASDGFLQFPSRQAATQGIENLTHVIKHVELNWGDDLRVDPLTPDFAQVATSWHEFLLDANGHEISESGFFTGLAEHRNGQWQFRNAHWSVATPSPKAP